MATIPLEEIRADGATRDSIPPIHEPVFLPVADIDDIGPMEPVLGLTIADEARAYPLRILLFHEIVNDTVGGVPVLVTYCPLCNSGVVFDRRLYGQTLDFGNTGRLRHFDMVMYDHTTESWWQQASGEAVIGALSGARLDLLPTRLESLAAFRARAPDGLVLVPADPAARPYGVSPFAGYDDLPLGRLERPYPLPQGIRPFDRVVVVGHEAWTLDLLRREREVAAGDLTLHWQPGQNSLHDAPRIAQGRDVGNVTVTRDGQDVPYDATFAATFAAFHPGGVWHR